MRKRWADEDLEILRRDYPHCSTRELARRLDRSERAVYGQAGTMGLLKSPQYLRSILIQPGERRGRGTEFKRGHRPHNKGVKGWDSGGNSVKTRFEPGNKGSKWLPVGSERVTEDGILQRKVSDTGHRRRDWKSVHSLLWEAHHGPVPAGHIVVFKNGDRADIRIENLELITRAECMRRNSIHNYPPELADAIRIRGVLNRRIRERTENDEKQD